jgi:hypothetical protein
MSSPDSGRVSRVNLNAPLHKFKILELSAFLLAAFLIGIDCPRWRR